MTAPGTSSEQLRIEPGGPADAEAMAELHARLFDPPWSASSIRQLLEHPGSIAFLARPAGLATPSGLILGRVAADEAELLTVGVAPEWQRHGIGHRLLECLCQAAHRANAARLYLEVAAGNTPALALYRALGAQVIGRRKAYYQRAGAAPEDAVNLAIPIGRPASTGGRAGGGRL